MVSALKHLKIQKKKGGGGNVLKTFKNPEAKVKGKSAKRRKFDKTPLKAETSELHSQDEGNQK